jgi:NADPH-dependent glutamate synthase beta subunit-like oxidoreductase
VSKSFNHVNAKTLDEAVRTLQKYRGKAKLIAGGTDLLSALKHRILPVWPEAIINIKTIPGLDYIKEDAEGLKIGALAKLADVARSATVNGKYKLLAEAAEAVATPQIRNMASVGGNLCEDMRCWYYRYPHQVGERFLCYLKGGKSCYALTGENQYHSIFGAARVAAPPCSSDCPASIDIPSYLSKIREGDLREAAKILLNTNPMPSITGRVCPHVCEQECNRSDFDGSVAIRDIERFIGDYILDNANEITDPPETDTGKRAAIIGSGPAGLSAAYYLRMSGHRVTVFDRMEEPGGMLAYGIPAYRLPKDIVRRVVKTIENAEVEFKLKFDVGKDINADDLLKDFDSVFLASGAWSQAPVGLAGEELTKSGLEFLTNINLGVKEVTGENVGVIGGGNVAIDAARVSLRLGAKKVSVFYRRTRTEMPATPEAIDAAIEEGVGLIYLAAPLRVIREDGVLKLECIRMKLGEPDDSGRARPIPIEGSEFVTEVDTLITTIGEEPQVPRGFQVELGSGNAVRVDSNMMTSREGVFAGGDCVSGPASVIEAIAAGRRAAAAMDLYLRGAGAQAEEKEEKAVKPFLKFNSEYLKRTSRAEISKLPISQRRIDVEDALGLGLSEVETEANRCFNCGCVAVNSSDIAVALLALDGKIKIASLRGTRVIPIEDFLGSLRNVLKSDEMVTEIQIPHPSDRDKQTFLKFRSRKAIDFATVSVASVITVIDGICKDARIALGAVAPRPFRATEAEKTIKGKTINATAEAAAEAAVREAVPLNKNAYKVEIVKALVKRALLS